MPRPVFTDDSMWGLPAKWHGPGGDWDGIRYPPLVFVAIGTFVSLVVFVAILPGVMTIVKALLGVAVGFVVSILLARKVFAHVDEWMPLKAWVQVFFDDLTTPRTPTEAHSATYDLRELT